MRTYPYENIPDAERRSVAMRHNFRITDRDGIAEALRLSPNRVSELTIRGQLVACNRNPLRYEVEHNISCYYNYKCCVGKEGWASCVGLPSEEVV
jgi:hypothetical protein